VGETAYLSLGSNLGDRAANLREAVAQMEVAGRLLAASALYETQPVGVTDQPWFLNCVAAIATDKSPRELLELALRVEATMGRLRVRDKGARNIDIDLVLFGDCVIDEPGLKIPHPAMHLRRFVLEPLVEIAPEVRHPVLGKPARLLLAELGAGRRCGGSEIAIPLRPWVEENLYHRGHGGSVGKPLGNYDPASGLFRPGDGRVFFGELLKEKVD